MELHWRQQQRFNIHQKPMFVAAKAVKFFDFLFKVFKRVHKFKCALFCDTFL